MPVIRTPDIKHSRYKNHHWKTVLVSTVLFMPVIRTYIATPKGVLISASTVITFSISMLISRQEVPRIRISGYN